MKDDATARILQAVSDAGGRMSVRDFLALALDAYYASGPKIGAEGDFYTSANVSVFPRALRRFATDALARLGKGARIVELGGGTGKMAAALKLDVTVVEPSQTLAESQRALGLRVVSSLADLEPAPTLFLANEVLDALPVHRIHHTPDGMREGIVELRDGLIVETTAPIELPALADAAKRLEPIVPVGCAAEVNLDARKILAQMAKASTSAIALFIDYGGREGETYGDFRPHGTLRGFRDHRATDWWDSPGAQDVTSDVDFDHVERVARVLGWEPVGYRLQGEFLMDLGLVDDMMQAMSDGHTSTYLAAKNLLLPGGMGERFKALALARGVPATPPLPGFREGIYGGDARP